MKPLTYGALERLVRGNHGSVYVDMPALGAVEVHRGSLLKLLAFSGPAKNSLSGYKAHFYEGRLLLCYRERRALIR